MLFNSFNFLIFFPAVTGLYFIFPHKYRWALLLVASCVFYMAFVPYYILILLVTILIDYFAALKIETTVGPKRKLYLTISIVSTCFVLIIFKYFNFFSVNFQAIASFLHWNYTCKLLNLVLPIGLSFHTFQSLSYVIEVYRSRQKAEKNFGIYALYVMFFPQLVAGPIERPQNLLHQFYEEHQFDFLRISTGLKRMVWGFFKKMIIADNLAQYISRVFDNPHGFSSLTLFVAALFFTVQIYCDFSGYSDIAIGSAQVLGFRLMENFKHPYLALSIPEFWSRWHISLSTWFKDYVYIPLGGNRVSVPRWCLNIMCTFLLSGLWHGASWTFIVWGALHGSYYVGYKLITHMCNKMRPIAQPCVVRVVVFFQWLVTFMLVLLTWIFFRANTLGDAWFTAYNAFFGIGDFLLSIAHAVTRLNFSPLARVIAPLFQPLFGSHLYLAYYFGLLGIFVVVEVVDHKQGGFIKAISLLKPWLRWLIYIIIVLGIMNLGVLQEVPFIYFQF